MVAVHELREKWAKEIPDIISPAHPEFENARKEIVKLGNLFTPSLPPSLNEFLFDYVVLNAVYPLAAISWSNGKEPKLEDEFERLKGQIALTLNPYEIEITQHESPKVTVHVYQQLSHKEKLRLLEDISNSSGNLPSSRIYVGGAVKTMSFVCNGRREGMTFEQIAAKLGRGYDSSAVRQLAKRGLKLGL